MTVEIKIDESEWRRADDLLKQLDKRVRRQAVEQGLDRASKVVVDQAKREVPQPGYPGDKPDKKPLRETLSHEIRSYPSGVFVAVVGAQYPAGAHAHLVHEGHDIWLPSPPYTEGADTVNTGRRSDPDPFLERAADNTQALQTQVIISTLTSFASSVR